MRRHAYFATAAATALLVAAGQACADYPLGFYLGAGVGSTNVSVEDPQDDYYYCCYPNGYDYDSGEDDVGFSAHLGYRFHRYFAAEIGYLDGGTPHWDHDYVYVPELDDVFDTQVDLEIQAVEVSGLAILPFASIWEVYARAGAAFWRADAEQVLYPPYNEPTYTRSVEYDGTDFLFGIGVGASPTPAWHLRLEYQSFPIDEDLLVTNNDATLDTLLFEVQFRTGL